MHRSDDELLSLQYDTKLINAQKQATKASQPTQKSAMNQDIYRKVSADVYSPMISHQVVIQLIPFNL